MCQPHSLYCVVLVLSFMLQCCSRTSQDCTIARQQAIIIYPHVIQPLLFAKGIVIDHFTYMMHCSTEYGPHATAACPACIAATAYIDSYLFYTQIIDNGAVRPHPAVCCNHDTSAAICLGCTPYYTHNIWQLCKSGGQASVVIHHHQADRSPIHAIW